MTDAPHRPLHVREYGNTPRIILRAALSGLCLGIVATIAVVIIGYVIEGTLMWDRAQWLVVPLLVGPVCLVLAVTPTVLFRIQIAEGRVRHIFLGRYVLSDYPLKDFICLRRFERGCAAVLYFRNKLGTVTHLYNASIRPLD